MSAAFAGVPGARLMSWLEGVHVLSQQLFLFAAAVLKPELNLCLGQTKPLGQLSLALVGDKAAALVFLLQLGPLIRRISLEGACPP